MCPSHCLRGTATPGCALFSPQEAARATPTPARHRHSCLCVLALSLCPAIGGSATHCLLWPRSCAAQALLPVLSWISFSAGSPRQPGRRICRPDPLPAQWPAHLERIAAVSATTMRSEKSCFGTTTTPTRTSCLASSPVSAAQEPRPRQRIRPRPKVGTARRVATVSYHVLKAQG